MDRTTSGSDMALVEVRTGEVSSSEARPRFASEARHAGPHVRIGPVYAALDLGTNNCRLLIARRPLPGDDSGAFRINRQLLPHRPPRRGPLAGRSSVRGGHRPHDRRAAHLPREDAAASCHTGAADHDRGLPRRRQQCRLPGPRGGRDGARARDRRSRDRSHAGDGGLRQPSPIRRPRASSCSTSVAARRRSSGSAARGPGERSDASLRARVRAWDSLKLGVVSLAERYGGRIVTPDIYEAMVAHVTGELAPFAARVADAPRGAHFHLLGTSGTVTTIAGVPSRADALRPPQGGRPVDVGTPTSRRLWRTCAACRSRSAPCMAASAPSAPISCLPAAPSSRRSAVASRPSACAIADRGLREGILMQLMGQRPHVVARTGLDHPARRPQDPRQDGAQAFALLDAVARASAQRPLRRAGQARWLPLARRPTSSSRSTSAIGS